MSQIGWLPALACALSAFVLGGVWYGPLFRRTWCREAGMSPDTTARHPRHTFATAFIAAFVAAVAFDWLLGPAPGLRTAVIDGVLVGLALVAMSFAINYAFAARSVKLWLIDGGYHTLQFTLYGLIIGLWQ
ncbi:MAG: DUF1761 domain-containing protein [Luteimonas sp.]